jgi:hypothetical protein
MPLSTIFQLYRKCGKNSHNAKKKSGLYELHGNSFLKIRFVAFKIEMHHKNQACDLQHGNS